MSNLIEIFKSMLDISLLSSAMIIIVLLIRAVAKDRIHIKIISFLWLLVILRLCLPGMLASPVHLDSLFTYDKQATEQHSVQSEVANFEHSNTNRTQQPRFQVDDRNLNDVYINEPIIVSSYDHVVRFINSLDLWALAAILWLIGSTFVFISTLKEYIVFGISIRRSIQPIVDRNMLDIVAAHKRTNRLRRSIRVSVCSSINMPMAIGLIRPHILLPIHITDELGKEHIDAILLHEVCHIKRNDIVKIYACELAKALHWFNPLVWISMKNFKADIELACDQKVLKFMKNGQEITYCESLLYASRFINKRRTPQFTVSLCENKSKLKERIMIMIKPKKKSKLVVVISLSIALIMFLTCFTTACQPTPEGDIVINKNPVATSQGNNASANSFEIAWHDTTEANALELSIDVDKKINANNIGIYTAKKSEINKEEIESIVQTLANGHSFRETTQMLSKEDIEERIIRLKAQISEKKSNPNSTDVSIEDMEQDIKRYEQQLLQLGEPSSSSSNSEAESNITNYEIELGNNLYANLSIGSDSITYYAGNRLYPSLDPQANLTTTVDLEGAKEIANTLINKLGFNDFKYQVSEIGYAVTSGENKEKDTTGYILYYTRDMNGISITSDRILSTTSEDAYSEGLYYEKIMVYVDNSGLTGFELFGLIEPTLTNEQVSLVGVEDIKNILIEQLKARHIWKEDSRIIRTSILVNDVKLGMMQTKSINNNDGYTIIPVWDFYGQISLTYEDAAEPIVYKYTASSLITLNALNGSVIERMHGY